MDWKSDMTDMTCTCYMVLLFYDPRHIRENMKIRFCFLIQSVQFPMDTRINKASIDYPICCNFFPWNNSEIFENCNIGILRFSDPNISGFFVLKNSQSGDANQKFFRWPPKPQKNCVNVFLRVHLNLSLFVFISYKIFRITTKETGLALVYSSSIYPIATVKVSNRYIQIYSTILSAYTTKCTMQDIMRGKFI